VRDSHDILEDDPPAPADARIAYGPEPLQFGDLRLPAGAGPHALAVVVHGGAWQAMYNLIHTGHLCVELAAAGIASWNVEYRRVGDPGGGWPGTLEDVVLALRHVAELPDVDPGRVVFVGHSAGGHLALLAARQVSAQAVVALAAVCEPEAWDNTAVGAFFGGAVPREGSPRQMLPIGVPQVLLHGTEDASVPYALSAGYVEAAGGEAKLVMLGGAGHFEPIDPQAAEWPRVLDVIRGLV
jgi:acetyl esterase/lipase